MDMPLPRASAADRRSSRDAGESALAQPARENAVAFEQIKLAIGDSFQIQTQNETGGARYYVKLIGYLKGKGVQVTMPEADGGICHVRDGQVFVVRFFAGKNAYAFTSSVLRASSIPYPHMHLAWPASVRGLMVRSGDRVAVRIICAIAVHEDLQTVSAAGMLTNLSISGALLSARNRLGEPGCLLAVKFRIAIGGIEFLATVDAAIRSVSAAESGEFLHGIQFAGLPNDVAIALTAFVYQKLAEAAH